MIKHLLILLFISLPIFVIGQEKVNYDDLQEVDGIFYLTGSKSPFSGDCYLLHKNGQIGMAGIIKNGKRDGQWAWFYESGSKKRFATYKDGVKQGATIFYYKNGVKKCEIIFDNDQNIRQNTWDEKGVKIKNPSFEQFQ